MRVLETENETPLVAIEIEADGDSETSIELDGDQEAEIETVETVVEASVAIAEIEADRDIELAQINAAIEIEHIEARKDEKGEVWERMENLSTQVESLTQQVSLLLESQLTPQVLLAETPMITTPQFTPDQTTETPMELEPESVAEKVETEIAESLPIKRRIRAI